MVNDNQARGKKRVEKKHVYLFLFLSLSLSLSLALSFSGAPAEAPKSSPKESYLPPEAKHDRIKNKTKGSNPEDDFFQK